MIEARAVKLGAALSSDRYLPAPVQREFQWTSQEAMTLLEDIFKAFSALGLDPQVREVENNDIALEPEDNLNQDDMDFETADDFDIPEEADDIQLEFNSETLLDAKINGLGRQNPPEIYNLNTIVLFRRPLAAESFYVFDGMQRLTSLAILLVSLRNTAGDDSLLQSRINDLLFFDIETGERRLEYPSKARTLYCLITNNTLQKKNRSSGDARMQDVYVAYEEKVKNWDDERRAAFLSFLMDRVYITFQILEDMSLAYQTFVTANDRGRKLTVGDILKGYFVELANSNNATSRQIDRIEQSWRRIRNLLHENAMNEFIVAVENIKFGFNPNTVPGELLLDLFAEDQPVDNLVDWVTGEFTRMAEIFALQKAFHASSKNSGVHLRFRQLSFLNWDEWRTIALALGLSHRGDFEKKAWRNKINLLYRACYTIEILGWTAKRKTLMAKALEELQNGKNPFYENKEEEIYGPLTFSDYLKGKAKDNLLRPFIRPDRRSTIMRWLETTYWKGEVPRSCTSRSSVEHILPVSPNAFWANIFSPQQHDKLNNLIGNLCIIDDRLNEEIGNHSWPKKREIYRTVQKRYKLVAQVADRRGWAEGHIKRRTQALMRKGARELLLIPPVQAD